jgi:hypothetical protein
LAHGQVNDADAVTTFFVVPLIGADGSFGAKATTGRGGSGIALLQSIT